VVGQRVAKLCLKTVTPAQRREIFPADIVASQAQSAEKRAMRQKDVSQSAATPFIGPSHCVQERINGAEYQPASVARFSHWAATAFGASWVFGG
jgi:hypothetical protein